MKTQIKHPCMLFWWLQLLVGLLKLSIFMCIAIYQYTSLCMHSLDKLSVEMPVFLNAAPSYQEGQVSQHTFDHPINLLHEKTDLRYLSSFRISSSFGEGKAVFHLKSQHRQHTSEPDCFGGVTVSPCYPSANFTVKLDQTSHLIWQKVSEACPSKMMDTSVLTAF